MLTGRKAKILSQQLQKLLCRQNRKLRLCPAVYTTHCMYIRTPNSVFATECKFLTFLEVYCSAERERARARYTSISSSLALYLSQRFFFYLSLPSREPAVYIISQNWTRDLRRSGVREFRRNMADRVLGVPLQLRYLRKMPALRAVVSNHPNILSKKY